MDRQRLVVFILLAISLVFLIAGAVMLGVGIHKANKKKDCPANGGDPTPSPPVDYSQISAIFVSTRHTDIDWDASLTDSTSVKFLAAATSVQKAINTALGPQSVAHIFLASPLPVKIIVHSFIADLVNGALKVDAYSSLIYSTSVTATDITNTGDMLNQKLGGAFSYGSPLQYCPTNPYPPPNSNPPSTTAAPSTTAQTLPAGSTTTIRGGAWCDASNKNVAVVFLVDVSLPISGNLTTKMALLRDYLSKVDLYVNLPQKGSWGNVSFFLVPYYDFTAYTLGSAPTLDHPTWADTVNSLNETLVNPNNNDSPNLAHALNYVQETIGKYIPSGTARALVIVTDGLDQGVNRAQTTIDTAQQLKNEYYSVSIVSAAQSTIANATLQSVASDPSHYYSLTDFTWLGNRGVLAATSYWICNSFYPSTPAPTTPPTRVPLEFSTVGPTTTGTTLPPTTTPLANCPMDVIFVIDESQTMLDTFFNTGLTYFANTADALVKLQSNVRFGIVAFNKNVVFSSYQDKGFYNISDFKTALGKIPRTTDVVDFAAGFGEVRNILRDFSRKTDSAVLPLIVFLTDGDQLDGNVAKVIPITSDIRSTYRAEIIGIGLNPSDFREGLIKATIGIGAGDNFPAPRYIRANNNDDLLSTVITSTTQNIDCGRAPAPPDMTCYTDITFIFEASYASKAMQEFEREAIKASVLHLRPFIGNTQGRISVIYFSSPDASSVLVSLNGDVDSVYSTVSNAMILNGGASDLAGALTLANGVIDQNHYGNAQIVVLFARGLYTDGNSTNCCNDPQPQADKLKSRAFVQAVMLGSVTDPKELAAISSTAVIDGNALVQEGGNAQANGQKLADALNPILDFQMKNQTCTGVQQFPPLCPEYIDVTLAFHANTSYMPMVKDFISQLVLPALFGGYLSQSAVTANSPVNLAILTVDYSSVTVFSDFTQRVSPAQYASIVQNIPNNASTSTIPYFSKAYSWTNDQRSQGKTRSWASTIVILITDALSSVDSPASELYRLQPAYAEAIQIGLLTTNLAVTDQPIIISDINQINPQFLKSAKGLASVLAAQACRVVTTTAAPTTTTTTAKTTPAPLPRPKPRMVWPDITILVDTSFDGNNAMTDRGFQQLRQFIYSYFLDQLYVGDQGSRVALATYDSQINIACYFSDIHNYYDLWDCIVNKFEYNLLNPRTKSRDLSMALNSLQTSVFNLTRGYAPVKENFLFIFTTGSSSSSVDSTAALQSIQRLGIRTVGIDLGAVMDKKELSTYGIDSIQVMNWMDEQNGIMGQNPLGYQIIDFVTGTHRQPLSNFYADFYFVLDLSFAMNGFFDSLKTFIHNFVNNLNLDDHMSRIWVVPYNSGVIQSAVLTQSTSLMDFESWYSSNFTYTVPTDAGANVGAAIDTVVSMIGATTNTNKLAHVIYVAQSPTANGTEKAAQLANRRDVQQYVLQTNVQVNYSSTLSNGFVYRCQGTDDLNNWLYYSRRPFNNVTQFFNDLIAMQEQYRQNNEMQLAEVQVDIAIALDQTGLTNTTFEALKSYLVGLVNRLHVSRTGTQIALQAFSGRQEVEGGFHFIDNRDANGVAQSIAALKYRSSNPNVTQSDLVTTLSQINRNFLVPQKGWRNGPTYVLMLPSGQSFYNTTQATADALKILQKARTFAIGTNGVRNDYVRQFVTGKTDDNYPTVPDPTALTAGSDVDKQLTLDITKWFEDLVYPTLPHIDDTNADFVFLIDHHISLTDAGFTAIKQYLTEFITNQVTNVGTRSRLSVVSYRYAAVIPEQSWDLNAFKSQVELMNAVNQLRYSSGSVSSDLSLAINYFFRNSTFGYNPNRLTIVVDIASAPNTTTPLFRDTMYGLNQETFTFAYTYSNNNGTRWDYINQFLGDDGYDNYHPQFAFQQTDRQFKQYVINSYAAWYATYG
ncbi:unnamed protein product, partial [Mesorhabditis belari]|uniref:VWFA domain-containing protein n=1 Tax=Mesorhabditis belari TaxID=2138241 RepID=A0AAF3EV38_9BILA